MTCNFTHLLFQEYEKLSYTEDDGPQLMNSRMDYKCIKI